MKNKSKMGKYKIITVSRIAKNVAHKGIYTTSTTLKYLIVDRGEIKRTVTAEKCGIFFNN